MRTRPHALPVRLLAGALITAQAACGGWRSSVLAPQQLIETNHPGTVRVTTVAGEQVTLHNPFLFGDSLSGFTDTRNGPKRARTVALADILSVETPDGGSPLLVAGGITLAIVAVVAALNDPKPQRPRPTTGSTEGLALGSCPAIDSWDGRDWRLDSGTYSGAITAGLARAEVDNLEYAVPEAGTLRLRVRTEPGETDHIDAVEVLAVTHPADARPIPDAAGRIHAVGVLTSPLTATDDRGRDVRTQVARRDGYRWESIPTGRDTASLSDIRSWLDLTFLRPPGAETARLVLDAVTTPWAAYLNREMIALNGTATDDWYAMIDRIPVAAAMFTATRTREAWLSLQLRTKDGWVPQGVYSEAGGEVGREQLVTLDLSAVEGDTVQVRLESAPSFWLVDYAGMDFGPATPVSVASLVPVRATTHDGRDVLPLLSRADRDALVQETGDWVELTYAVPQSTDDARVSYLVRTTGWYRIHTPHAGEPRTALLTQLATEPWAISRLSTMRLNEALAQMEARAADR